jgi:putative DNA primase/helicase
MTLKEFISSLGHEPPSEIPAGKITRFGKDKNLWIKLFDDGLGAVFGDWKTGEQFVWQSSNKSKVDIKAIETAKANKDLERLNTHLAAAKRAEELFYSASEADSEHPYLISKSVGAHGIRQRKDLLLIPVYSVIGDMQSIQFIDPVGNKRFLSGGKVSGGCHMIGLISPYKPAVICEGYATGATLLEDGSPFIVIAFNAGNLINVANDLRRQLPLQEIVFAADADPVGEAKAIEAANAVGGTVVIPEFHSADKKLTDFNDMLRGKK